MVDAKDTGGVWDLIVRRFNKRRNARAERNLRMDEERFKSISAKTKYHIDKKKAKAAWCAHMHACAGNVRYGHCVCDLCTYTADALFAARSDLCKLIRHVKHNFDKSGNGDDYFRNEEQRQLAQIY